MKNILIIVAIIALLGVGGWYLANSNSENTGPTSAEHESIAPATFTLADIKMHNSQSSCYVVIRGGVYDLTTWIAQHPGGPQAILGICGTDATAAFDAQHKGQGRPEATLTSFKIGTLSQ